MTQSKTPTLDKLPKELRDRVIELAASKIVLKEIEKAKAEAALNSVSDKERPLSSPGHT
jgi:hypothetical protein